MPRTNNATKTQIARRNCILFCVIVVIWVLLDQLTKVFFDSQPTNIPSIDIGGIVELTLVHNFGAAWGSFSGMTIGLIVVTLLLCVGIIVYAFFVSSEASVIEMTGLALVFAGGIGNLIDRIARGYVVDFISPVFIDFPTFNIADIGITCGIILVIIALVIKFISTGTKASSN